MIAAALSVAVSAVFSGVLARRWPGRRRPHEAAWAVGLAMFAVAAAGGLARQLSGVTELNYKTFYLFGALLNVPWLALGTLFLLAPRTVARRVLWGLVAFSALCVVAIAISPVDLAKAADTGKGFDAAPLPRYLALISNVAGTIVLAGGALWSAWVFLRRRHNGRRALGNVVIAAGVIVVAAGGTAAFTGASGILEWTNFLGVLVMFAGFLLI